MSELFDSSQYETKETCKECIHCFYDYTNSDKKGFYCAITKSTRTQCGLKKVKLKDKACLRFEKGE